MSVKQVFIQQIDNFVNELCSIFPNSKEILIFREKYNLVRYANSKLVVEYFIMYILPHKKKIIEQEESFFLEGGGQEEIKDNSGLKFRDSLKSLWISEISEENKEIIWKYFKIFIILCEKYILENT
jgi:hypothetical protein